MKLSVTTLGWPASSLDQILSDIKQVGGFEGLDFRGLEQAMDITRLQVFTDKVERSKLVETIRAAGLTISGLSTSVRLIADAKGNRNEQELEPYCVLADVLEVPYVRIFGGKRRDGQSRADWMREGIESMKRMLYVTGRCKAMICLETHDDWCHSADVAELLDAVNHPRAVALWDVMITSTAGGETVQQSAANLGQRIRYTHMKDAVRKGDDWQLCLPGQGQVDLVGAAKLLKDIGYDGWLTFEWEKRWHPELPDAAEALPAYRKLLEPVK